ncbi:hypothetical protein SDC9_91331 [bioreactor metagenome]|uniref:Uncharacterized protein n=1 Tax=bioreactor metagenome TaxID=1076179 RepID=A0A644ZUY4_9ZZZZ
MKKKIIALFIAAILLTSCGQVSMSTPSVPTPTLTNTPTLLPIITLTPNPTPTVEIKTIDQIVCIDEGHLSEESNVGWLSHYMGSLNSEERNIGLVAIYTGNTIDGEFFYAYKPIEMKVKGCLKAGQTLILYMFDNEGKLAATLTGYFPAYTDSGDKLYRQGIFGTFTDELTGKDTPLQLYEDYASGDSLDHEYQTAGVNDDSLIDQAAMNFLIWSATDQKERVAQMIEYPIQVYFGGKRKWIENEAEFLSNYDSIFTTDFKETLKKAVPKHMFAKWSGIMLLSGEVWFNADGKVISLISR